MRLYEHGFLRAKCWLFYSDRPGQQLLFDRFRPVLAIVGSSNFTGPELTTNQELNLAHKVLLDPDDIEDKDAAYAVRRLTDAKPSPNITNAQRQLLKSEVGARAIIDLERWYERQWEDSRDFKAELIELLDASKFGGKEYLRFALAAQDRVFNHHMLVDGMPSTSEEYAGTSALDAHETCDIVDHTWTWGYMLMATGDGVWADRIERACFNAGMGAIKKDWKAIQYFSSPNQVIATQTSNHVPDSDPDTVPWMAYAPNPGHESSCCGGNVHRLFPNYVIRMWMKDAKDGGLAAMLYGSSTVRAEVGATREPVEIRQETDYPFGEDINFTITTSKPVHFPLSLRIPSWCKTPRISLNGKPLALPAINKGFIWISRIFNPGDRITLSLPMQSALTYWPENGMAIEHGPLVYAMAVKDAWSPVVTPLWSTAAYPEWDANPADAWNYVFAATDLKFVSQSDFQRGPMTKDPWVDPPVSITVAMKKIPGWTLKANPHHPSWLQTPPLPDVDGEMAMQIGHAADEKIALVPYGSTHLRLAIFANANP